MILIPLLPPPTMSAMLALQPIPRRLAMTSPISAGNWSSTTTLLLRQNFERVMLP